MTGLWLVSYLILWGLVVILLFLVIGTLGQLGLLRRPQEPSRLEPMKPPIKSEDDGPPIGSPLPAFVAETFNGFGTVVPGTSREKKGTVLLFLSATCDSCQRLADPLNKYVELREHREEVIVLLEGDQRICEGFQSLFPLHVPAICASDRRFKDQFKVRTIPFGLFYDAQGILVRKGIMSSGLYLRALLGETSLVSDLAPDYVFPLPGSTEAPVSAKA